MEKQTQVLPFAYPRLHMGDPISPISPFGPGNSLKVAPAATGAGGDAPQQHIHRRELNAQDTLESESGAPSIELARLFGQNSRPHRVPDPSQPTGYRLARPGEAAENVSGVDGPNPDHQ